MHSLYYVEETGGGPPVGIVWGTKDPLIPGEALVREAAARFGGAHCEFLDCGHLLMFEQPGPILAWLRRHLERVSLDAVSGDW